jgi:hypothetical protein
VSDEIECNLRKWVVLLHLDFFGALEIFDIPLTAIRHSFIFHVEILLETFNFGIGPVHCTEAAPQIRHPVFMATPSSSTSAPIAVAVAIVTLKRRSVENTWIENKIIHHCVRKQDKAENRVP